MRKVKKFAKPAESKQPKRAYTIAKAGPIRACFPWPLLLLLMVLLFVPCTTAGEILYYSGLQYTFSTPYNSNWEYLWDATCCSDTTNPCCYDPTKINENIFVLTAPIVDRPTEVTITVVVRDKNLISCMGMARFKITVRPLNGIAVVKEHLGGDGSFPFTGTGFTGSCSLNSFTLSQSNDYTIFCPNLNPGPYSITELVPAGWDLSNITVTGTDAANYQISGSSITITHLLGESPVITFADKKKSSITVIKSTVGGDAEFNFTGTGFPAGSALESFKLMNGQSASESSLTSGTAYTIAEMPLAGWDLNSIAVTGTDAKNYQISGGSITITPQPGESPVIAFTNAKRGSITVKKVTSPSGSAQQFEFKPSYAGSFWLSDTSEPNNSGPLSPGTYSITESAIPGWNLTDIAVTGIASTPTIDKTTGTVSFYLAAGEAAFVTYSNSRLGSITGYKWNDVNGNCKLDKGEQKLPDWPIILKDSSGNPVASTTTDGNGNYRFDDVQKGKFTLEETLLPGWNSTCPAGGKVDVEITSDSVVQNFGNRRSGSIVVIKDAIPDDSQSFAFTGTLGDFSLKDDGTDSNRAIFENLQAGDYEILEQIPSSWFLESVECKGASSDKTPNGLIVHLEAGKSATVKFVDTSIIKGLRLTKTTLNTSVKRGQDIVYTIEVSNDGSLPLTNVTLWDVLPDSVELIWVNPEPDSSFNWHIGTLSPRQRFVVDLIVRVKKIEIFYDMTGRVQGEGYVNVYNDYDTSPRPESVKNCAYAKADFTEAISSCALTHIEDPGTELMKREFGSGVYASEEAVKMRTENKSIKIAASLSASYKPTTFSLPKGRSIDYGTRWTEKFKGRNEASGATITEEYTLASRIEKEGSMELDKNGSTMRSEVEFEGTGHIGFLKKASPDAAAKAKPIYEAQEDYSGNFRVYEYVDEYGTSVFSNRSTTGSGFAAVKARIGDSQRSYESGTGSYHSEELIDTPSSYMAKNISLVYEPASYTYSPRFWANQSMKWSEGMWSKSGGLEGGVDIAGWTNSRQPAASSCLADSISPGTLISERYTYLDSLQKETIASGLNEMKTEASFTGLADYRVVRHGDNNTDSIDNEERYFGSYDIKRHVLLTGTSKYDTPHLTLIKEGETKTEWYNGTEATLAEYKISILNDGNRALSTIRIRDVFPPGTEYIKSTIRPLGLNPFEADWNLIHLGIGEKITIGLTLNITEFAQGNVVNRVQACGNHGNGTVCAENYSVLEFSWLTCCPPKVMLSKKAWLDDVDPTVVHYRVTVLNQASEVIAARLRDQLPGSMNLLDASIAPNIDSTDHMIWSLPEIMPGMSKTIEYTTKALRDGGYTNIVHLDATAINGDSFSKAEAAAYIEVIGTGNAPRTFRYGDWEPPNWNLSTSESILTTEPELDLWEESVMENLTAAAVAERFDVT